jgi:hypothetical protein
MGPCEWELAQAFTQEETLEALLDDKKAEGLDET